MTNNMIKKLVFTSFWLMALSISHYCSFSFFVGAGTLHLSPFLAIAPLLGSIWGIGISSGILGCWSLSKYLINGMAITAGIPTLLATLSWSSHKHTSKHLSFILHVLFPIACIIIFCINPMSHEAWPYALYWLIPVALHFMHGKSLITAAIQSTFVAHASGSIMWLFLRPMPAASWLSLIPVVAVERFVLAGLMVLAVRAGTSFFSLLEKQEKVPGRIS